MRTIGHLFKDHLPDPIKRTLLAAKAIPGKQLRARLAQDYHFPGGFKRIYFFHIRKTAGTSVNQAFFGVCGEGGEAVQNSIFQSNRGWSIVGNYVFVIHNKYLAESGDYYYAYSHAPIHEIRLPPNTFTITCLRDPVKRVISHYRNLMHYRMNNTGKRILRQEGSWLGGSFSDFLDNIPTAHLMRQIYMFSRSFDIDEAVQNIVNLNFVMFTEDFANGLNELSERLDLKLELYHGKSEYDPVQVGDEEEKRLRDMLEPEYRLLRRVKSYIARHT